MVNPQAHPLAQRIGHWVNLISFIVLIATGFWIHYPTPDMPMTLVRYLHFVFMFIFIANGVVRGYISIFGKDRDIKTILLDKRDLRIAIPMVKYYLFMSKTHPPIKKYNPLQKAAYLLMQPMAIVQIITGFILYMPARFGWAADFLGGMAQVRSLHYLIMWLFIVIIIIHVYLVFSEAVAEFWFMFFGKTGEKKGSH